MVMEYSKLPALIPDRTELCRVDDDPFADFVPRVIVEFQLVEEEPAATRVIKVCTRAVSRLSISLCKSSRDVVNKLPGSFLKGELGASLCTNSTKMDDPAPDSLRPKLS
jgi:hypothetical protein